MPQLAFANTFWDEYEVLEKSVKAGVRKAMSKFQKLTVAELHADKGLHLESVDIARDARMRTIRINDFWRGVVLAPDDGSDTFLLVNVVSHDKAYEWASKRIYTVNTATRGLEVRNVVAIEQLTPVLEQAAAQAPSRLFEEYSDFTLRELGIDEGTLRAIRTIIDKPQLEAFGTLLPEDQFEVLQYLAEGFKPDAVYRDVVAVRRPADAGPEPTEDLATAIANTSSRITFVSGPAELEEVLSKPFAAWRVFLHPTQRRVAYRVSYGGPVQVTGGPGTGKTVVALHRVKHLLGRSPDGGRILLTTFTNAMAAALRQNLALLLEDPALLDRVEVTTVNSLAHYVVQERKGRAPALINDADERVRWGRLVRKFDLAWTEQFLAQEYRHVILAQDIGSSEEYLKAVRRGRGSALGPLQRAKVWRALEEFTRQLESEGKRTHLQLCSEAARLRRNAGPDFPRYDHVVVDEAQDLHPAQWRLLRAVVPERPDDLFITGDPHQRIYDSKVALGSLGISVAGRSSRLRVNYRNTEEILVWATGIVRNELVEDLGGDGMETLAGYQSVLHGARPRTAAFGSEEAELTALVDQVRQWTDAGVRTSEIAVCTRFNNLIDKAVHRLVAVGIPVALVKDNPAADEEGVRIATTHSMKGLEFRCVAVVGVTAGAFPFSRAVTDETVDRLQHETDLLAERCLLFVACTRAREALYVSWSGAPSSFLAA
ncbi:UvrD-helicase domain-containing protein [Actinacidiphila oryziradicis]|uniref:DNA 3'-5' helicase n=1 Tax=Actinacidiphila oryziradicis TaxID=2571141 RepID=A0A4U0SPQ1_9ACTN|nr:ATP-dependent helicase [Actinacidiphila oryziradicis]TKA11922.1 DNA helicase UvrD [Actinacidiphila oryziradicis]